MGLSSPSNQQLFDPIRRRWVEATPEERVRQRCIRKLVEDLGFPLGLLAVEKALRDLPQVESQAPARRIDLVCFSPEMQPLMLIECKAKQLDQRAMEQVMGYNFFVRSPVVAVISQEETCVAIWSVKEGRYKLRSCLPTYREIMTGRGHAS